jgi:hypothetical protein
MTKHKKGKPVEAALMRDASALQQSPEDGPRRKLARHVGGCDVNSVGGFEQAY